MKIDVSFLGFPELRHLSRQKTISLEIDGDTFNDLLGALDGVYREKFKNAVLNRDGQVDSTVQILHNDNNWVKRDNASRILSDGDRIVFMRMMGGG